MKKVILSIVYLAAALFFVAPKAVGNTSLAVTLPQELIALIGFGALVAVTYLLKALGDLLKIDLTGHATTIAAGLAAVIVQVLNWALGIVPAAYDNLLTAFLTFLVILLGGIGTAYLIFTPRKDVVTLLP